MDAAGLLTSSRRRTLRSTGSLGGSVSECGTLLLLLALLDLCQEGLSRLLLPML